MLKTNVLPFVRPTEVSVAPSNDLSDYCEVYLTTDDEDTRQAILACQPLAYRRY